MENNLEHFVYILECKDGSLYTGYTNNLTKRVATHQSGKGAKYTRGRRPVKLVYSMGFMTKEEALREEYRIKQLPRTRKQNMLQKGED